MSRSLHITWSQYRVCFVSVVLLLCFFGAAQSAAAASLSLSPNTGVYTSGQTFSARVVVNTSGAAINAADGTITFNPNELSVVSISKGSIFNLWTAEPSFSNTAGTISFSGGSPTGYTGSAGTVLSITFRTKGSGTSRVNFSNGSVLAADGRGTNVLTNMGGGTYTISAATSEPAPEVIIEYVPPANTPAAPVITSETHADPAGWSTNTTAELRWSLPGDVTAVRTLLDGSPSSIPSRVYDDPISSITLEDLEDGVQYFHLQFRNADGWGRVAHYRLAVDTVAPRDVVLQLPANADLASPEQTILVQANEATSGIARYLIKLDDAEPYEDTVATSSITLKDLEPGYHTLIVEVIDAAGNSTLGTLSFTILAFDKPQFTEYPTEVSENVIPVIRGATRPNAQVEVTITRVGQPDGEANSTQIYTVTSGADGVFTIIPEGTFTAGVYELRAVATDQYGAKSEPSDTVRMIVQKPGYIVLGSLAVSFLSVLIPLLALLMLSGLGVWYFLASLRRTRRTVGREASEALTILKKEFAALTSEIATHEAALADSRKTKKLTKAEAAVLTALRTSLAASLKRVEKEIMDVEDIVD